MALLSSQWPKGVKKGSKKGVKMGQNGSFWGYIGVYRGFRPISSINPLKPPKRGHFGPLLDPLLGRFAITRL